MDRVRTLATYTVREILDDMCSQLGHPECAKHCVKVLCCRHWFAFARELEYVQDHCLVSWGLPLMLVVTLKKTIIEISKKERVSQTYGYLNYTIRPFIATSGPARFVSWASERYEKHQDVEVWAARKLQRKWRCRQALKRLEEHKSKKSEQIAKAMTLQLTKEQKEDKARAMLSALVPKWRERQDRKLKKTANGARKAASVDAKVLTGTSIKGLTSSGELLQNNIAAEFVIYGSIVPDCEVTRLVKKIVGCVGQDKNDSVLYIHRLVTLNWLEDLDDLQNVDDETWVRWEIPYAMVQEIKIALETRPAEI